MGGHYEKGLYDQYLDTMAKLEKMNAKLDAMEQQHREEISQLKAEHQKEISELKAELHKKDEVIKNLTEENEHLTNEVSRLKSILNGNSKNSSTPPSQDQKKSRKNANEFNARTKTGKKKGAQQGHKGATLTRKAVEDMLASGQCRHQVKHIGDESHPYVTRYVLDIHVETVITEYRIHSNNSKKFHIPEYLRSDVTYGSEIKALIIALYGIGVVAIDRIVTLIQGITENRIHIAAGTVYRICRFFSEKAAPSLNNIECRLMNQTVIYTDATNVSVDGNQTYIRNISTKDAVMYYSMPKKTQEEIGKLTVLQKHTGTMVHDHETTLYHFHSHHAECNVHIIRYLRKNYEDTNNNWSSSMTQLLTTANREKNLLWKTGITCFPQEQIKQYESEYDKVLENGFQQNEKTKPKWAKEAEAALLRRLTKYKTNHLLFLQDFEVGFDNNMSERDLRKCKNRQKVSGGFRTPDGCAMFCDILSIIETAKRDSLNVLEAIHEVLSGKTLFGLGPAEQ